MASKPDTSQKTQLVSNAKTSLKLHPLCHLVISLDVWTIVALFWLLIFFLLAKADIIFNNVSVSLTIKLLYFPNDVKDQSNTCGIWCIILKNTEQGKYSKIWDLQRHCCRPVHSWQNNSKDHDWKQTNQCQQDQTEQ